MKLIIQDHALCERFTYPTFPDSIPEAIEFLLSHRRLAWTPTDGCGLLQMYSVSNQPHMTLISVYATYDGNDQHYTMECRK